MLLILPFLLIRILVATSSNTENGRAQRTSPVPAPFSSSQRSLAAIKVDPSGKVYTTQILKQQLANELGLPLRDLRIVDPSFPSQIQASFISRKKAILFCIENIKVVVQHNEALVFGPFQPEVQEFVPALQLQIAQAAAGEAAGWAVSARFEHIVLEAALNVVCNNLLRRVRALSPAVSSALTALRAESRGLEVIQTQADELLPLKNKIDELKKRVKEIKRAITDILSSDEDMSLMYLSDNFESSVSNQINQFAQNNQKNQNRESRENREDREDREDSQSREDRERESAISASYKNEISNSDGNNGNNGYNGNNGNSNGNFNGFDMNKIDTNNANIKGNYINSGNSGNSVSMGMNKKTDIVDTMNLEMLFENYLNEIEWIASEVEEVIDEITNTEENVVLQLDILRNRILRFELSLSMSSYVVTCGALITGLFGMNLISHLENDKNVFYVVTSIIITGMTAMYLSFSRYQKQTFGKL